LIAVVPSEDAHYSEYIAACDARRGTSNQPRVSHGATSLEVRCHPAVNLELSETRWLICRTEFISGFTGSAGVAVISENKAALSTDGRYFAQAEKQLDTNWELLKQGLPDVPTWGDWYL
jgi:Xaa-Pro aminopeptidase